MMKAGETFYFYYNGSTSTPSGGVWLNVIAEADAIRTIAEVDMGSQFIRYDGFSSRDGSGFIKFKTRQYNLDGNGGDTSLLFSDDNFGTYTKITAEKDCYFDVTGIFRNSTAALNAFLWKYNSLGTLIEQFEVYSPTPNQFATQSYQLRMTKGDYFLIKANTTLTDDLDSCILQVKATPFKTEALVAIQKQETAYVAHNTFDNTTQGGDAVSGAWRIPTMNELTGNTSFISLAGSQLVLEKGTYLIDGFTSFYLVNNFQSRLYNVSDGQTVAVGSKGHSSSVTAAGGFSYIKGTISLYKTTTLEFQARVATTYLGNGFGVGSADFGENNIFRKYAITKIS